MDTTRVNLTIASGTAESEAFTLVDALGNVGMVKTPAAWTAATIGFKVSDSFGGTYAPLRDPTGNLVAVSGVITNAAGWYRLPYELAGAFYVKLWSMNAGSDVNQEADRALVIVAKG